MLFVRKRGPLITGITSLMSNSPTLGNGGQLWKVLLAFRPLKVLPPLLMKVSLTQTWNLLTCSMTSLLLWDPLFLLWTGLPWPSTNFQLIFILLLIEDTAEALLSSKLHSSVGPDNISAWLLCENTAVLSRPLCSIFNASVREGFIPSLWKSANVTPIEKCSPPLDVDSDFRPISLTPIISKILESFPYQWLLKSVADKIDPLQFGSLKGSSTNMALVHLLHKWYEAMDKGGSSLRICLLDFSKAFDRIDHNILLNKLIRMNVHPVLTNWIANFLTDRQQRTRVGPYFSDWKNINAGVPQGTKLGPLLFLIMVNDLVVSDNAVKYVDDTTLWEIIPKDTQSCLPSIVSECSDWALVNNMKINPSKTKELRVSFSFQSPLYAPIIINDRVIDTVSEAKLLGVVISSDLKWNSHVDYVHKKAAKRLYGLRLLQRNALPAEVLLSVYCTYIRPIVEYACEAWHFNLPQYLSDQIENIQKRALRIIFPALKYIDSMSRAKLTTLHERRSVLCNRFFSNMISPSHKLNALVPPRNVLTYNLRTHATLLEPKCRTDRFSNSFVPAATRVYNIQKL